MDLNHMTPQGAAISDIRSLLSKLFENWHMGAGKAPTIGGEYGVPLKTPAPVPAMPAAPTDAQAQAIADANANGPMTDANLPQSITNAPRMQPAAPDQQGMDALMSQLVDPTGGITQGPNANIDDGTRQRALMWALRNNPPQA